LVLALPRKPAGGNVIGHASTYRIYLRKAGSDRIAKMIDSQYHPYSDVRFTVNEKGIVDSVPDAPKKKTATKGKDSDD
jgi:DNA repair protein RadA